MGKRTSKYENEEITVSVTKRAVYFLFHLHKTVHEQQDIQGYMYWNKMAAGLILVHQRNS